MEQFLDKVAAVNDVINTFVWVKIGIIILLGVGIVTTVCTKFFQLSHLGLWWKNTIGSLFRKHVIGHTKDKGAISPFQALCTALAATVGTGNIAGVSAAICIGGAGAVFWMWLAAFFGMMTNYSENVLGIYFRRRNKAGEWSGGAMYYLEDGLGGKRGCKHLGRILAVVFAAGWGFMKIKMNAAKEQKAAAKAEEERKVSNGSGTDPDGGIPANQHV